jgi:hypothetical protein
MTDASIRTRSADADVAVRSRARAALACAGAVYVVAWLIGLFSAPAAPSPAASDATVHAFFVQHHAATLVQALLVHGIAGVALAVFVVSLARCLPGSPTDAMRRLLLVAGVGAAVISLAQLGIEIALYRHVDGDGDGDGDARATASLFHAVNVADTIKLMLLAIAIGAATRLAASLPTWIRAVGAALVPTLILGGLAFLIDSGALTAILSLSLLLLLLWVAALSVAVPKGTRQR